MDKQRLFSIGKLSKLTGVHIQSLRYYETLGILRPAYVDPHSQYRYYTFAQTRIVEAIQYCVELDLPLKDFRRFLSETDGCIDYTALLECGARTAREKMRRIQDRLSFMEGMQKEIHHAELCRTRPVTRAVLPERLCWAIPYDGAQTDPTFHSAMYRLISELERYGFHAGFNNGQLLRCTEQGFSSYLFIDLRENTETIQNMPQLIRIPGGEYLCTVSGESRIRESPGNFSGAFSEQL